jgi:membrane protein YdbS with pleckstrin-like domain
MITAEEEKFLAYWSKNREILGTTKSKLVRGFPVASFFGIPIMLFIVFVYFFMPDWYMRISKSSPATFVVVFIAVLILIIFYAFMRMHFKWEMNEQLYKELLHKKSKMQ